MSTGDRTVHVKVPHGEVVRYDRAGKWFFEGTNGRLALRLGDAVAIALLPGAYIYFDLPGGGSFDAKVRKRRGF